MSKEFLNFAEISKNVAFIDVLNHYNIPFKETKTEFRTEDGAVINKKKNLYFNPKEPADKGSVINFLSFRHIAPLRETALELKKIFIEKPKKPKRDIPTLELHHCKQLEDWGFSKEFCEKYGVGLVKQRSVMAGKIAFKVGDQGYIGKEVKKDGWFYPKGFHRDMLYNPTGSHGDCIILVVSALECLHFINLGFPYTVASLGIGLTNAQEDLLKKFKRILVFHPEPQNTILRISKYCFCKAIAIDNSVELCEEEVKKYF